jgi:hypothetical protein
MKKNIIILAAHDDGSGAHVSMCHIHRGLQNATEDQHFKPLIIYLNSSNYGSDWAEKFWYADKENSWIRKENLDSWPSDSELKDKDGIWIRTDNILKFKKNYDGTLDVSGTRQLLTRFKTGFKGWAFQIRNVPENRVALTIEMGVPQLSHWAKERGIPAISVGDMIWSRTLWRSLEGAGEYDEEMLEAIRTIAEYERCATEVWLLPVVAPREYADFLAEAQIPFLTLPGFFGSEPANEEKQEQRKQLDLKSKKLVIMSAGLTEVWTKIYEDIGELIKSKAGSIEFALLYPKKDLKNNTWCLRLIDQGNERDIPHPGVLLSIFANADLGVTRGGITITEFIAAKIPFIVVQELNHWLSQRQQAATKEAGLCHTASLSRLQNNEKALEIITQCLNSNENEKIKARLGFFRFGVENEWAAYLLDHHILRTY